MSVRKIVLAAPLCVLGKVIQPTDTIQIIANSRASATPAPSDSDITCGRSVPSETATIGHVPPVTAMIEEGESPKKMRFSAPEKQG